MCVCVEGEGEDVEEECICVSVEGEGFEGVHGRWAVCVGVHGWRVCMYVG